MHPFDAYARLLNWPFWPAMQFKRKNIIILFILFYFCLSSSRAALVPRGPVYQTPLLHRENGTRFVNFCLLFNVYGSGSRSGSCDSYIKYYIL